MLLYNKQKQMLGSLILLIDKYKTNIKLLQFRTHDPVNTKQKWSVIKITLKPVKTAT